MIVADPHKAVKDLYEAVTKLAKENPDNLYDKSESSTGLCCNTTGKCTNGTEGCIIGQGMMLIGFSKQELSEHEDSVVHDLAAEILLCDMDEFDGDRLLTWLDLVQKFQDNGKTWGEAVMEADKQMKECGWDNLKDNE